MNDSTKSLTARRVVLSGFFFLTGICFASWASRIPDIKMQLGLSDGAFGGILFFLPIGSFVGIPISGSLTAKQGSKVMVIIASIIYPISLVALGFAGGLLGGFFVANAISPLEQFVFVAVVGWVFLFFGHPYLLPGEPNKNHVSKIWNKPSPLMWQFGLIAFTNMICEGMMFDWSGVYFQDIVKVPNEWRTTGYICFMGSMTTGRMFSDNLINYWGARKQLVLSGLVVTLGLIVATAYPHLIVSSIGFMLVGFGVSSVIPTIYGTVGRTTEPSKVSIALASVSSIGFFGFLIGPPIIGFLSQAIGLRWAFLTVSSLGIITALRANQLKKYL